MRLVSLGLGAALSLLPSFLLAQADSVHPEAATGISEIKQATASEYMAVTANPHATSAALAMLEQGGSAVDAAIAAQLVLGLVEPQSSGLGGGAFILTYGGDGDASEKKALRFYDGRETAPASVDEDYFLEAGQPRRFFDALIGGYSVGVPGLVRTLVLAHREQGKLPWEKLFEPALKLADDGFAVSPRLHQLLVKMPKVAVREPIKAFFFDADGKPHPVGHLLKNPAYAQTLRTLIKDPEDFYTGKLAQQIVEAVRNDPHNPGKMTLEDMRGYEPKMRKPACSAFREYRVCGAPAPSSGATTVGAILGMLQDFPLEKMQPGSVELTHLFIEASELAFADRNTYVGDPDFVSVPTEQLLDPAYLRKRARLISPEKAQPSPPGKIDTSKLQSTSPELPSTTHLVVMDSNGNAVSMTSTIESGFGSRVMVGGFLLNNQLTDFSFVPRTEDGQRIANRIEGGKRPRSSMSPSIVFNKDGSPRLLIGSPGGSAIIGYTSRTILYHLVHGMPLAEAIAAGNIIAKGRGVTLEQGHFDGETVTALEKKGHKVALRNLNSGLHGIALQDGVLVGGADTRREGVPGGK